jgi:cyanate lyase
MQRTDLTEKILDIKREKGCCWRDICDAIGDVSDTLIIGRCWAR